MPLMPKRVKYRKQQRGNMSGLAHTGNLISFGSFGLQALDRVWMSAVQIEACRIAVNRCMKRKGKVWIRVFPDKPITKKPLEMRMGKGKAATEGWVAVVKPGRILFEVDGVTETIAKEALRLAATKLPIKTRFVTRRR
jgi:large subunit ribosomal protein L16